MSLFHRENKNQSNAIINNDAQLITAVHPKSPISEQFRTLRTNISFMAIDNPIKALASASVSEGKSTVTDNLAVVWAQTGQKVLLVDTDLRRSTLHRTFDLDNREGLPMVLLEAISRGIPCLSSAVSGVFSVIQPSINGELYKKGDKKDFEIQLQKILNSKYNINLLKNSIDKFYIDAYLNRFINLLIDGECYDQ